MHFSRMPHLAWKTFSTARIRSCRRDQLQRAQGKKFFLMLEFNVGAYRVSLKNKYCPLSGRFHDFFTRNSQFLFSFGALPFSGPLWQKVSLHGAAMMSILSTQFKKQICLIRKLLHRVLGAKGT